MIPEYTATNKLNEENNTIHACKCTVYVQCMYVYIQYALVVIVKNFAEKIMFKFCEWITFCSFLWIH